MTTTGRVVERMAVGHGALHKARKCFGNLDRGKRWLISKTTNVERDKIAFQCSALFNGLIQQMLNKQLSFCNQCTYLVCIFCFLIVFYFYFYWSIQKLRIRALSLLGAMATSLELLTRTCPTRPSMTQGIRRTGTTQRDRWIWWLFWWDIWDRLASFYHLLPSSSPFLKISNSKI